MPFTFSRIIFPGYPERISVVDFVGAASSRDRFNSRLEAAPTAVFFSYLSLPHKRIIFFNSDTFSISLFPIGSGLKLNIYLFFSFQSEKFSKQQFLVLAFLLISLGK
jgi:hypothetical protein